MKSMYEFLTSAVTQKSLSGLTEMLRLIASETESYACILWRMAPADSGPDKHLFAVAEWCADGRKCANRNLPLDDSHTGTAIRELRQTVVRDVATEVNHVDTFLRESDIVTFCSTPLKFLDGIDGAVSVYRKVGQPYSDHSLAIAESATRLVGPLFRVIEDEVSFRVMRQVDEALRQPPLSPSTESLDVVKPAMRKICDELKAAFNCREVSVFLEDRLERPSFFDLAYTTWDVVPEKTSYRAKKKDGITGYTLANPRKRIIIFDLGDEEAVQRQYPGIRWGDALRLKLKDDLAHDRETRDAGVPNPLSFMAAPMVAEGRVVGVIRCAVGLRPVYFDERQYLILERVASQIGFFWSRLLERRELAEEKGALDELVKRMQHLNNFAHIEIMKSTPSEDLIIQEALKLIRRVIRGAEITDVRLLDQKTRTLRFAVTDGEAWKKRNPKDLERRTREAYNVDEHPPKSAGVQVFQTGEKYLVRDPKSDPLYFGNFPDTKHMVIAPLKLRSEADREEIVGVLDIRSVISRDFSDSSIAIAEFLGSQLALYRRLVTTVKELREKLEELKRMREQQIQINADLAHQIRHPAIASVMRVQSLLRSLPRDDETSQKLRAIRGITARTMHVALNIDLFARLASGETIPVNRKPIERADLLRLLINTAQDAAYLASTDTRRRTSHVEEEGFKKIGVLYADVNLLEQAVTQLLDNAFKYSFPDTQVLVNAGITGAGNVRISVFSEGIVLRGDDVMSCIERGWQGDEARDVSETGSGIGLWIVHNIMKAHRGILNPVPTNSEGITEFALIFPPGVEK